MRYIEFHYYREIVRCDVGHYPMLFIGSICWHHNKMSAISLNPAQFYTRPKMGHLYSQNL